MQAVGLATLLPGSDALQLAMFVGYTVAGIPGGFVSLFAAILPPTVIMLGRGDAASPNTTRSLGQPLCRGIDSRRGSPHPDCRLENIQGKRRRVVLDGKLSCLAAQG